jgi:hypothetical protein
MSLTRQEFLKMAVSLAEEIHFHTGSTRRKGWLRKSFTVTWWRGIHSYLWEHESQQAWHEKLAPINHRFLILLHGLMRNVWMWNVGCYIIPVNCAIRITNGNYLFKTDSSIKYGKDMLASVIRYSKAVVNKHDFRIVPFLLPLYNLLVQLIFYFVSVI